MQYIVTCVRCVKLYYMYLFPKDIGDTTLFVLFYCHFYSIVYVSCA